MPKIMKPPPEYSNTDVLTGGDWYDGPDPDPGFYKGTLKLLLLQKKDVDGASQIHMMALCEISEGKFKGAGVTKWLQMTADGSKWLNQFLMALTDGSPAQTAGICKAFKEIGYGVEKNDKGKPIVTQIGNNFKPIGKPIAFMVKRRTIEKGPRSGETVSEISRFVVPRFGAGDDTDDAAPEDLLDDTDSTDLDDVSTDTSSGLDEFDEDTTMNPDPVGATASGGDDPWSI